MNAINRLVFSAGQKAHEQLYQASLNIHNTDIPCTSSRVITDWILMNGFSPKLYVDTVSFRKDQIPTDRVSSTRKGLKCTLTLTPETAPIPLQLWEGGLKSDGLTYEFHAVDANFSA